MADTTEPSSARPQSRRMNWWRLVVAMGAGTLLGLAFPLPGWGGLAWLGPGLLLAGGVGLSPGAAFRYGWLGGASYYLVTLRWLLHIPFPAGAIAGWLALSAYCALYPALWVWLSLRLLKLNPGDDPSLREAARTLSGRPWRVRLFQLLLVAALWVALEMVLARFLTGFPWCPLGLTQWRNAPLIQVASLTGVYGVSFLLVWFSVALVAAVAGATQRPANRFGWTADLRAPLFVLLIVVGVGFSRVMRQPANPPDTVTLALVQPSIPQDLIWDSEANPARFEKVRELSRQALATRPDALVWPEGSMPDLTREQFVAMTNLLAGTGAWWIFGSADSEVAPDGTGTNWLHYNAAFLFTPEGRYDDTYHKRRLVIFGEYIPFERSLPFMKWLTPIGASFTPGQEPGAFRFGPRTNAVASPMICFEPVFAHYTRAHVAPETDFVLELTNDGWFGESGAQWQHAASVVFRAVENGVPFVRATNNGLTCWIDEFGRMRDLFRAASGSVHEAGFTLVTVPLRPKDGASPLTWYHDQGDVFGWICVGLSAVVLTLTWRRSQSSPRSSSSPSSSPR